MGGALSIASSVLVPEVDAVVAFYGVPSSQLADPAQAKAPVQAHFGELDNFVGFSDVTVCQFLLSLSMLTNICFSFPLELSTCPCLWCSWVKLLVVFVVFLFGCIDFQL